LISVNPSAAQGVSMRFIDINKDLCSGN